MICLHCGYEADTNQSACLRCGNMLTASSADVSQVRDEARQQESIRQMTITPRPSPLETWSSAFPPGALLSKGRYSLLEKCGDQRWSKGAYETHWHARDLLEKEALVLLCEMELPDMRTASKQANLRTALRAFSYASMHSHVPALIDVFRESERDCFVFEAIEGESLLARLQRSGQMLQEQDAIECCLQITEVLETLAQKEPPIVHGLISPEHILVTRGGNWFLTNFSLVLACGAKQFLTHPDSSILSPFAPPEYLEGLIDIRSDLYSLLAVTYYALTGSFPRGQKLHTAVPTPLQAILMKGLSPTTSQRYQHPSALLQELLALRPHTSGRREQRRGHKAYTWQNKTNVSTSLTTQRHFHMLPIPLDRQEEQKSVVMPPMPGERLSSAVSNVQDPVTKIFSSLAIPEEPGVTEKSLLPRVEKLPPLPQGNDALAALLWMTSIVICCLIPVILQ